MRTQVLVVGIAAGCLALVMVSVTAWQRDARAEAASAAQSLAPNPPARADDAEPEMLATLAIAPPVEVEGTRELPGGNSAPRSAPEGVSTAPLAMDLLAELQSARDHGLVSDHRLAEFLAQLHLERGDPRRALEFLELAGSKNVGLWSAVAQKLAANGDVAGQRAALLAALEAAPKNNSLLANLSQLDPELAIQSISLQLAAAPPPGPAGLRAMLASALIDGGRAAEAAVLVDELLAANPEDGRTIALLARIDPARALAYVEQSLASAREPDEMRGTLVSLLVTAGDPGRAQATLERLANDGHAIDPSDWGQIATMWLESGESARGTAALQRALSVEHGDPDNWVHDLEELSPRELLVALERRVATDEAENDEYWGSLADSYWAAGRRGDAQAAWERAGALDPRDDEWRGRLRALDQGRDPYED